MAISPHQRFHLRRSVLGLLIAVLLVGLGIRAGTTASAQSGAVSVTGILNIVYGGLFRIPGEASDTYTTLHAT